MEKGYKSVIEMYADLTCYQRIPMIKTPTVFFHSQDDPVCGSDTLDYEVVKSNPFVAVATTKYGGHLGYIESIFNTDPWYLKVALKFFSGIKNNM